MKRVQLFVPWLDEPRGSFRSRNRGSSWLPFALAGVLLGTGARVAVDLSRPTPPPPVERTTPVPAMAAAGTSPATAGVK
jgi:hypothetical protein